MPLKTATKFEVTYRTTISGYSELKDSGRQRLLEAHERIHERHEATGQGHTGRLIVDYTQGSICNMVFEEHEPLSQSDLDVLIEHASANGTRGTVRMANPPENNL